MKQILLRDFSGGLNDTADPTRVPDTQSPDLENVEVLDSGAVKRRKGYSVLMDTGAVSPVDFLARLRTDQGDFIVTHQQNGEWLATLVEGEGDGTPVPAHSVNPAWTHFRSAPYFTADKAIEVRSRGTVTPAVLLTGPSGTVKMTTSGSGYTLNNGVSTVSVPLGTRHVTFDNPNGEVTVTPVPIAERIVTISRETTSAGSSIRETESVDSYPQMLTAKQVVISGGFSSTLTSSNNNAFSTVMDYRLFGFRISYRRTHNVSAIVTAYAPDGTKIAEFGYDNNDGTPRESIFAISERNGDITVTLQQYQGRAVNYSVTRPAAEVDTKLRFYAYLYSQVAGTLRRGTLWFDRLEIDGVPTIFESAQIAPISTGWTVGRNTSSEYIRHYNDVCVDMLQGFFDSTAFTLFEGVANGRPSAAQYGGNLYIGSTLDDTHAFNGTATAEQTTMPTGVPVMVAKDDRLFIGGNTLDDGIIEYSAVGDPTDFTEVSGGGAIRPAPMGSGNPTTAMTVWNAYIVWASPRSVSSIKTAGAPDEWEVKELTQRFGCVAPNSMVTTPNAVVFLSTQGVMAWGSILDFGGDGEGFAILSENIRGTLGRITHPAVATATFHDGKYYLSICTDGTGENNETLVLKIPVSKDDTAAWTRYSYGAAYLTDIDGVLYGGGYDGKVRVLETGDTDDGARIVMRYVTPALGLSPLWKDYREVYVGTDGSAGQTIKVQTATDDTPDSPVISFTSSGDLAVKRYAHRKRGNSTSLTFTGESSTTPIVLTQVSVTYNERKR